MLELFLAFAAGYAARYLQQQLSPADVSSAGGHATTQSGGGPSDPKLPPNK